MLDKKKTLSFFQMLESFFFLVNSIQCNSIPLTKIHAASIV